MFSHLNYPGSVTESVISKFSFQDPSGPLANVVERDNSIIRISGSVFVSGQPSSSQVSGARIPIRVRDPIALEMSSSMKWTMSSTTIELDINFMVPRRE